MESSQRRTWWQTVVHDDVFLIQMKVLRAGGGDGKTWQCALGRSCRMDSLLHCLNRWYNARLSVLVYIMFYNFIGGINSALRTGMPNSLTVGSKLHNHSIQWPLCRCCQTSSLTSGSVGDIFLTHLSLKNFPGIFENSVFTSGLYFVEIFWTLFSVLQSFSRCHELIF